MNCLRCGKETEERAVFCPECLKDMERHPVKPGTMIRIPQRPAPDPKKAAKKSREYTPEEQLHAAKTLVQFLFVLVLGLLGGLLVTGTLLFHLLSQPQELPEETLPPSGRNYTVTIPAEDG